MFDKENIKFFSFDGYDFNEKAGVIEFFYSFDDIIHFTEKLTFSDGTRGLSERERKALHRTFDYLHLAIGISYYKAALPRKIIVRHMKLSSMASDFFDKLYTTGLQEFSYENKVSFDGMTLFQQEKSTSYQAFDLSLRKLTVIPMGGGKDSFVSQDILNTFGIDNLLFHIGDHVALRDVSGGESIIRVKREISKNLYALNEKGAYNGHVPISAIYAFITLSCSVIYSYDTVVMSNERSSNVGSTMPNGMVVNHQYSKSFEFESDFIMLVNEEILSSYRYFSILRPFSEISIAKMFSQVTSAHHKFISCNNSLKQSNSTQAWCLNCSKCRFVFLSLAPYIPKEELVSIFQKNLLNDQEQLEGFHALVGFGLSKPFECVGEVEESITAFYLLSQEPVWKDDIVVRNISENVLVDIKDKERLRQVVLTPDYTSNKIPSDFLMLVKKYYGL